MDHWILLFAIWAIVEFVQFLRKRPYLVRMKTGAWWAVVIATIESVGSAKPETFQASQWTVILMACLLNGAVVLAVYWFRALLAKGWVRFRT